MCGIYGFFYFDRNRRADPETAVPMGETLIHRGPDDSGLLVDGPAALGHRRLSIIDLSPCGHQPMSNEDGSIWITFNGEIYNFGPLADELKAKGHVFRSKTDTEVILHLFEEHGIDCLNRLNGMFAFALWDKKNHELFLARDRMGVKPLHYTLLQDQIIFGSEIKALLKHPDIPKALDTEALSEYLSYDYIPAPKSIFRNIRKIMPGEYLHIRNGEARCTRYWQMPTEETGRIRREEDYAEELRALLRDSVRLRLIADVPVGVFLSGGLDSSTLSAWMQDITPGNVHAYNIAFEESAFDESAYAKRIADDLGIHYSSEKLSVHRALDLIPKLMDFLDEPFGDASFLPTLLLSQYTRKFVKVALSGDGSDELFAGYPTYVAHRMTGWYRPLSGILGPPLRFLINRLPVSHGYFSFDYKAKKFISAAHVGDAAERNARWLGTFSPEIQRRLFSRDFAETVRLSDPYAAARTRYAECGSSDMLQKVLYTDQTLFLPDNMLVKVDRASMAASLEVRNPFLDYRIAEFAARLPADLKLRNFGTKYILKKAMAGKLPEEIITRRKQGFAIPSAKWFHGELKPFLSDIFSPAKIRREGVFDPEMIQKILSDHFTRRRDNRKEIYTLLNFELWYNRYIA